MRKPIFILTLSLILLTSSITCATINQNQIEIINLQIPIDKINLHHSSTGDEITIDNFGTLQIPGKPSLPTKIYSIAIPPQASFISLGYTIGQKTILPNQYTINPVPPPKTSDPTKNNIQNTLNQRYQENYNTTYNQDTPYPSSIVTYEGTSGFRKYNLVNLRINPLTYQPQSGTLTYYSDITVQIHYEIKNNSTHIQYDNEQEFEQRAQDLILNYNNAQVWYTTGQSGINTYEYVIITLESLTSHIQDIVDWEETKGKNVNVVTTTWINNNYTGYDLAEKIRNFLRDKYPSEQWGIQDLLIIGHQADIPMRETWHDAGSGRAETDFYYAELTLPDNQSWDADGDHQYGEDTDPIDFYGEINVGRIPWSDPATVQHICQKSVAYEQNNDPSFKNNILMLAAFIDSNTDGATFMEYLANQTIHPWMAYWMKTRLYEALSPFPKDHILTHQNVIDTWSTGKFAFVSWHAHGSPQGTSFITINDCQYLNDDYPAIVSAASCSNSDTNYLNIGQALMQQGAVGFLGANKVAYYCRGWDDPTDGSDQSFKYFFKKYITSENNTQGQAHQKALTKMYEQGLWTYPRYETFIHGSLWGNPDLGITPYTENNPPAQPTKPQGPTQGKIRVEHTYTTSTTDPENDQLYYLFDWDDGTNSGWLGPYQPGETVEAKHTWTKKDTYEIKVITQDTNGTKSIWSDPLPIEIPLNNQQINQPRLHIIQNILKNHPILILILQIVINHLY